jgi:transcriptional regulator with XRE-family HTH domain
MGEKWRIVDYYKICNILWVMRGLELKQARERRGWSQQQAARRLGVSQPYLSLLESDRRSLTPRLAQRCARVLALSPAALPLPATLASTENAALAKYLAQFGYPAFAYLRAGPPQRNPAEVLLSALAMSDCEARLVEGLPWLLLEFDLDSAWLVQQARLHNLQNRLGFVVNLARRVAEQTPHHRHHAESLLRLQQELERSRLAAEDTLCRASMGAAERRWLRENRPPEAAVWNLLTDWRLEHLRYAA